MEKKMRLLITVISLIFLTSCESLNPTMDSSLLQEMETKTNETTAYRYVENELAYERISFEDNPQLLLPEASIYYTIVEGHIKKDSTGPVIPTTATTKDKFKNDKIISENERDYSDYKEYICYQSDNKNFSIRINEPVFNTLKVVYPIFNYGNTTAEKEIRLLALLDVADAKYDKLYRTLHISFGEWPPSIIKERARDVQNETGIFRDTKYLLMLVQLASRFEPISYNFKIRICTRELETFRIRFLFEKQLPI